MRDKLIARIRELQEETMYLTGEHLSLMSNVDLMCMLEELAIEAYAQKRASSFVPDKNDIIYRQGE